MKKITGILLTLMMLVNLIPAAFASSEAYTIDEVYFSNLSGKVMENPGTSCVVNVKVTKQAERIGEDVIVIATYATDGSMIGFTTVAGTMTKGKTETFSTLVVSPAGKNIGVVKAYMWNNISEMKPLSEVNQTIVNEMDEGIELPPIGEDPTKENYIPKVVTARGTIVETPRSFSGLYNGEYRVEGLHYVPDTLDDIYTEEEYCAIKNRSSAIEAEYDLGEWYNGQRADIVLTELDLNDYLFYDMQFELSMNEDGDYIVLDAAPYSEPDCRIFDASEYVPQSKLSPSNKFSNCGHIRFGDKYYGYDYGNGIEIYVNGAEYDIVRVGDTYSDITLDNLLGNAQGKIRLLCDADGFWKIFIDYYDIAVVESVSYKNGQTTVVMTPASNAMAAITKLAVNDDSVEAGYVDMSVTNGGNNISLKDLREGNVIAIATDLGAASRQIVDPMFMDILVSSDTISGKVRGENIEDETYYINGSYYKCVNYASTGLSVGSTYKITLDPFGRIFDYEESAVAVNYAIAEKWNSNSETLTLVLADGTTESYTLASNVSVTDVTGCAISVEGANGLIYDSAYAKKSPYNRVIEYTVKASDNTIRSIMTVTPTNLMGVEYKERTSKLGSATINDATKVINAEEYDGSVNDYHAFNVDDFVDGRTYDAYAFKSAGSATYPFVMLTRIGTAFDSHARFAVVKDGTAAEDETDAGEECFSIDVLKDGAEGKLFFWSLPTELAAGDVIYYDEYYDGVVKNIYKVFDYSVNTFTPFSVISELMGKYDQGLWGFDLYDDGSDVKLVYGVVTDTNENGIELAPIPVANGYIDTNSGIYSPGATIGAATYSFSNECDVYAYNSYDATAIKESDKISPTSVTGIIPSDFTLFEAYSGSRIYNYFYDENSNGSYDTGELKRDDYTNYAVAMMVDGEIVEIFAINNYKPEIITVAATEDVVLYEGYKTSEALVHNGEDFETTGKVRYLNKEYPIAESAELYINDIKYEGTITNKILDANLKYASYVELTANTSTKLFTRISVYTESTDNFAIIERWNSSSETVQLVLADGTKAEYELSSSVAMCDITDILYGDGNTSGTKMNVCERVVTYKVKSSDNTIGAIEQASPVALVGAEYRERTSKLGSASLRPATKVIDASEYFGSASDYYTFDVENFKDGISYDAYAYRTAGSIYYDFVILTRAGSAFDSSSRFAVVKNVRGYYVDDNDAEYISLVVMEGGEEKELKFYSHPTSLSIGDAIFYELDRDGFVKNTYEVYSHTYSPTFTPFTSIEAMEGKYQTGKWDTMNGSSDGWNFNLYNDGSAIQLVYGVVAEVNGSNVTLAPIPASGADIDINNDVNSANTIGGNKYALDANAEVYVYDTGDTQSLREYDKLYTTGTVIASDFTMFETAKDSNIYAATSATGENRDDYTNYALAMIVGGEIVEIYTINK